jgi:alpha-galactosidase
MRKLHYLWVCLIFLLMAGNSYGSTPTIPDMVRARKCLLAITGKHTAALSFQYGKESSQAIFRRSKYTQVHYKDDKGIAGLRGIYEDPISHLRCVVEAKMPADMPVVEWCCYIENTGRDTTALISDIMAIDMPVLLKQGVKKEYDIFYSEGTRGRFDDFSLHDSIVRPTDHISFVTAGGESSSRFLPFFNVNRNDEGVILGIGWTGQWKLDILPSDKSVRLKAGMEHTSLVLYPGEKIRTPLIALLFWQGEKIKAQNMLRRYIVKYSSPKPGGKDVQIPISFPAWGGMTTAHHLRNIEVIKEKNLGYNNYWIDSGWFGGPHETVEYQDHATEDWWGHVGDWAINTTQHPQGMRPISNAAHAAGLKFLLWFEPERAVAGTPVTLQHPEWFMSLPKEKVRHTVGQWKHVDDLLINLGIPEARQWITDYISKEITDFGMDILRIDANVSELPYWKNNDAPNRIGMTEIRYVEGLYRYLDDLLKAHPNLMIDNCAGGGNRLDLEMLRRGVALHRTDYVCYASALPIGGQVQSYSIMHWIPYSNTGSRIRPYDTYRFRSDMNAGLNFSFLQRDDKGSYTVIPEDYPWDWHREMMRQHAAVRECYNGDYFPLTPFVKDDSAWCAYELYRPDLGKGFILAFRRDNATADKITVYPGDINPNSRYDFENFDLKKHTVVSGKDLIKNGLVIALDKPHSSALLKITKVR